MGITGKEIVMGLVGLVLIIAVIIFGSTDADKSTDERIQETIDTMSGEAQQEETQILDDPIIEECKRVGGEWIEFPNTCVDSCYKARNKVYECGEMLRMGCECGPDRCWNLKNKTCEPNLIPENIYCDSDEDCITSCGKKIGRGYCYNKDYVSFDIDNLSSHQIDDTCCRCEDCQPCRACKCVDNKCVEKWTKGDCC